jgi:hypothetical protein
MIVIVMMIMIGGRDYLGDGNAVCRSYLQLQQLAVGS